MAHIWDSVNRFVNLIFGEIITPRLAQITVIQHGPAMVKGAPKKAQQGIWHEEARELRREGWTFHQIAMKVGVTPAAVYFVINPDKRAKYVKRKGAKAEASAPPVEAV